MNWDLGSCSTFAISHLLKEGGNLLWCQIISPLTVAHLQWWVLGGRERKPKLSFFPAFSTYLPGWEKEPGMHNSLWSPQKQPSYVETVQASVGLYLLFPSLLPLLVPWPLMLLFEQGHDLSLKEKSIYNLKSFIWLRNFTTAFGRKLFTGGIFSYIFVLEKLLDNYCY